MKYLTKKQLNKDESNNFFKQQDVTFLRYAKYNHYVANEISFNLVYKFTWVRFFIYGVPSSGVNSDNI